jgi:hypothetical protein
LFALVQQMKNALGNLDLIRANPIRISLLRANWKRKKRKITGLCMSLIMW